MARARQALAYAVKWYQRGDLPEVLAPPRESLRALPCLPEPTAILDGAGQCRNLPVVGPGVRVLSQPQPTLALVGQAGGRPAGVCLALLEPTRILLGTWLAVGVSWEGTLQVCFGNHRRTAPLDGWGDLILGPLEPGCVLVLPAPRWRALPELGEGTVDVTCPWERMSLALEGPLGHPTVQ